MKDDYTYEFSLPHFVHFLFKTLGESSFDLGIDRVYKGAT